VGLFLAAGLWHLYFRQVADSAEHRLTTLTADDRTRLARDVYTFLHLPLVAGVVITALGMKKTLQQIADTDHYDLSEPLHGVVAWALPGGVGLFLLAAALIVLRTSNRRSPALFAAAAVCLAAGPVITLIPSLVALGLLAAGVTVLGHALKVSSDSEPRGSRSPAS
jgi:low temperature requirement protein LtrA